MRIAFETDADGDGAKFDASNEAGMIDPAWSAFTDLTMIILGACLASAVTLRVHQQRCREAVDRAARTWALRFADRLERFAMASPRLPASDLQRDEGAPGVPSLPPFETITTDDDPGWLALEPDLATDCWAFSARVEQARDIVALIGRYEDADAVRKEVERQSASLALMAWGLSKRLRARYRLASASSSGLAEASIFAIGATVAADAQLEPSRTAPAL